MRVKESEDFFPTVVRLEESNVGVLEWRFDYFKYATLP